jgi:putative membrane protein
MTPENKLKKWKLFFCGFIMGAADLVPGISGGTIAFILGFYQQLLDSIKTINASSLRLLFTGKISLFFQTIAWQFLLTLCCGIGTAFVTLAGLFHFILADETYRVYLYSVFLGLILASFCVCIRQLKEWKASHMLSLICGALIAYLCTGSFFEQSAQGPYAIKMELNARSLTNYNSSQKLLTHLSEETLGAMLAKGSVKPVTDVFDNEGKWLGQAEDLVKPYYGSQIDPWLIFCGAIAICALLLPGISGSYLLTLLGVYPVVIGALADFLAAAKQLHFDQESFFVLFSLFLGIIGGVAVFARFVSWLLNRYPSGAIAALSGFMIGALRSVWPFWSYEYILLPLKLHKGPQLLPLDPILPSLTSPYVIYAVLCAGGGFTVVLVAEYLAQLKASLPNQKKSSTSKRVS